MYIPSYEPSSRFLAHIKEDKLENGESKEAFLKKAYDKWHDYFEHEFERYEKTLKLNMEHRRNVEKAVDNLVKALKDAGISQAGSYSGHENDGYDVASIQLQFTGDGSDILREIMICTQSSCWSGLKVETTEDEINRQADFHAKMDLDIAVSLQDYEKSEREKEKAEAEAYLKYEREFYEEWAQWEKDHPDKAGKPWPECPYSGQYSSPRAYFKAMEEKDKPAEPAEPDPEPAEVSDNKPDDLLDEPTKFWKELKEDLYAHLEGRDSKFLKLYDSLDTNSQCLVDAYVDSCREFSDAMNDGLTGLGLYSFNERRANAHEAMLEAFGLEDDYAARTATKNFDYVDTYDVTSRRYVHRPHPEPENLLAYVLVKCRQHMLKRQSTHIGSTAEIVQRIMEP